LRTGGSAESGDPAAARFEAGYVLRALDRLPRQGPEFPWLMSRDYRADVKLLRRGPVADPNLRFAANAQQRAQVASA
jgi:hypothetical protein